jgi:glycine cleavage system H protein
MKAPSQLYYSESHEWVKVEGGIGTVGITDYAQDSLGEVVYIELPEEGTPVTKGEEFGAIESVKAASDLNAPITGVVSEVNGDLEDTPELINEDSYNHWIIKIEIEDESELERLMDAESYLKFCETAD